MGSPAGAWGLDTRGGCSSPESRIPWACEEVGTPHNSEAEAGTQGALGGRSRRGAPAGLPRGLGRVLAAVPTRPGARLGGARPVRLS